MHLLLDIAAEVCQLPRDQFVLGGAPVDGLTIDRQSQVSADHFSRPANVLVLVLCLMCLRSWRLTIIVYGLGMFGLVGWSIAIPTVMGIAIGIWIDHIWQHRFSWTLMCLFMGVVMGCSIAWYWVKRESLVAMDYENGNSANASDDEVGGSQPQ